MSSSKRGFVLHGEQLRKRVCEELSFLECCNIDSHRLAVLVMLTVEGALSEEAVELEVVASQRHDDEAVHAAQAIDLLREEFIRHLQAVRSLLETNERTEATGRFHFDQWLPNGDFTVLYDPDCTMIPLGP